MRDKKFYKKKDDLDEKQYKGFFIPCATGKEKFSVSEAYNILNEVNIFEYSNNSLLKSYIHLFMKISNL